MGDAAKTGIGILTLYGGPVGYIYGIVDLGYGLYSGTTLTDRIGAGIDNTLNN